MNTFSLIQDLLSLRERVLERLHSLETLARNRPASAATAGELSAMEQSLKKSFEELEETRRRLQAEAEREKSEWSASLSKLEDDRRLLAEAWERVERQRVEDFAAADSNLSVHALGQNPQAVPAIDSARAIVSAPIRTAGPDSVAASPVAAAILRQFQTLCSDVRHNTQTRRAAR